MRDVTEIVHQLRQAVVSGRRFQQQELVDQLLRAIPMPQGEHRTLVAVWNTRYGSCTDCGAPAAYELVDRCGSGKHDKACSVCAASAAASEKVELRYLFEED